MLNDFKNLKVLTKCWIFEFPTNFRYIFLIGTTHFDKSVLKMILYGPRFRIDQSWPGNIGNWGLQHSLYSWKSWKSQFFNLILSWKYWKSGFFNFLLSWKYWKAEFFKFLLSWKYWKYECFNFLLSWKYWKSEFSNFLLSWKYWKSEFSYFLSILEIYGKLIFHISS